MIINVGLLQTKADWFGFGKKFRSRKNFEKIDRNRKFNSSKIWILRTRKKRKENSEWERFKTVNANLFYNFIVHAKK